MFEYINRYTKGIQIVLVFDTKNKYSLIAEIYENNTFTGGWDVVKSNNENAHFSSLDAAKNFIETIGMLK